jgi:membrane-associated phospholipid phosphatase
VYEHAYPAERIPRRRSTERVERSGVASALLLAGLCVAALALVWCVAELVPAARVRDAAVLRDFLALNGPHVNGLANVLPHLLDPLKFTIWGLALVFIALARQRPRVALAVVAVMALAPFSADLLKPLLAHPHLRAGAKLIGPGSWPSGHSTAAAVLALSAVLVAPARLRPLVAIVGAAFALAVGAALLIHGWHMPSDVLGGYLLALLWMSLAVAALRAGERLWPSRTAVAKAPLVDS